MTLRGTRGAQDALAALCDRWKVAVASRGRVLVTRRTRDGYQDRGLVLGKDAIQKINAVEGIRMSAAAATRTADFDRRGLTPAQRRAEIVRAYTRAK